MILRESGYGCAVLNVVGDFCCIKMCLCKDFIDLPPGPRPLPYTCTTTPSNCPNASALSAP